VCCGGHCYAPAPLFGCCNGNWADLGNDAQNCGACGKACTPNQVCVYGTCQDCGPCQACDLASGKCGLACPGTCISAAVEYYASQSPAYKSLLNFLLNQGFKQYSEDSLFLYNGAAGLGSTFTAHLSSGAGGAEALVMNSTDTAWKATGTVAFVLQQSVVQYALFVDANGVLRKFFPHSLPSLFTGEPIRSAAIGSFQPPSVSSGLSLATFSVPDPNSAYCQICSFLCSALAGVEKGLCGAVSANACSNLSKGLEQYGPLGNLICSAVASLLCAKGTEGDPAGCIAGCQKWCQCDLSSSPCGNVCCPLSQGYQCTSGVCAPICGNLCQDPDRGCVPINCYDQCFECDMFDGTCKRIGSVPCGTGCCPDGQTCCSGSCSDTRTDPRNCGTCGNVCTGGKICQNGSCSCTSGLTDCSGTCVNTNTNPNNCGQCGRQCSSIYGGTPGGCVNGHCTCPSGWGQCGSYPNLDQWCCKWGYNGCCVTGDCSICPDFNGCCESRSGWFFCCPQGTTCQGYDTCA
jgi:hypothetical protein